MFAVLDQFLSLIFFILLPICIYGGSLVCLIAGLAGLKNVSKGYSHAQQAGLLLVFSGVLFSYHLGYKHAEKSCELEWTCWFIGMMSIALSSVIVSIPLAMKVPSLIVAIFLWGFLLIGPGELEPAEPDLVDTNESSVKVIDESPTEVKRLNTCKTIEEYRWKYLNPESPDYLPPIDPEPESRPKEKR